MYLFYDQTVNGRSPDMPWGGRDGQLVIRGSLDSGVIAIEYSADGWKSHVDLSFVPLAGEEDPVTTMTAVGVRTFKVGIGRIRLRCASKVGTEAKFSAGIVERAGNL